MALRKILPRIGLSLLVLVLADQLALYVLLQDDVLFGRPVAPFDPPLFSPSQHESFGRIQSHLSSGNPPATAFRFDAELGWCSPRDGGHGEFRYDWAGCRVADEPLAREKAPGVRRIVTLGCSMTHGEEVGARETWSALLDEMRDDVEVANLGVAAYGLDQALMRYRRDGRSLEADEVWLALLPGAALRVTTLYRPLLRHWSLDIGFKPRFSLGEGDGLVLIDNPARSLEHIAAMLTSQEEFLASIGRGDSWVERARTAYASRGSCAAHYSFTGRILLSLREAGDRDIEQHFARRGDETYRLLRAIVRAGEAEARGQGARFRFLILPGLSELEQRAAAGRGYWEELCRELAAGGTEVCDLSSALDAGPRHELFAPHGHYSPKGNRVVAEALEGMLDG